MIAATVGEDFRGLQGKVEAFGWELKPTKKVGAHMHPGRAADVILRGKTIGCLYEVHPKVLKNFDIKSKVIVVEVNVQMIHEMQIKTTSTYRELPKYPSVQRDVSILIHRTDLAETYFKAIERSDQKLIESVELIDEYTGKNVADDKRALTYSITYRASDRTLTEDEVSAIHKQTLDGLKKKGAVIRD
ncbi:hypothetical protein IPJ72_00705 [Candidatus Peregrinibacteria bacterium]|nr:MAG: hypothetical protein IPJ72_00705 [Candidatus Peregrinibacteria bacterium]